jgi:hypothetical protein
LKFL